MLSPQNRQLATALDLSDVSNDEELSASILALLTSARDAQSQTPLSKICHEISQAGAASLLDPLYTLPILVSCKDPAAREMLSLVGECGSAKEVVMAVQEAVERLASVCEGDDEDEDDAGDGSTLSYPSQLTILVELYSACLPRLKLRRKTASETLRPLLLDLESVIQLASTRASQEEGRTLISSVSHLVNRLEVWSKAVGDSEDEAKVCNELLKSLLDCTLVACEHCVRSSLAQRSFETLFPQLTIDSAVTPGWESGEEAVSDATGAYTSLGVSTTSVLSTPSTAAMIIFAHSGSDTLVSSQLPKLIPIIVASLQTGSAFDEALTILLHALDPRQASPRPYLPEEVIYPLFAVLPPLSSSHPDPVVRHQAFRLLSILLASCPPPIRLQFLRDLAIDPDFPQMRVAAVGLVKEAVLEALAHPPNIFASPAFFEVFGPILFRPDPPDPQNLHLGEFKDSPEAARLIECLGTYYTILQRDTANLTHMRNSDVMEEVERNLLTPLRLALEKWEKPPEPSQQTDGRLLVGSLELSLELVDGAVANIRETQRV
ncbi:hypothetical protein FPV67DRAFT_1163310 [Lyophyllum atratum]|nr:hypothetical protein FPV67DRAFT_1163310 [Lyophyllum atratum]